MATSSFGRTVEIKDDKAAARLIKVAESHKPIKKIDISKEIERGRSFLKECYSR